MQLLPLGPTFEFHYLLLLLLSVLLSSKLSLITILHKLYCNSHHFGWYQFNPKHKKNSRKYVQNKQAEERSESFKEKYDSFSSSMTCISFSPSLNSSILNTSGVVTIPSFKKSFLKEISDSFGCNERQRDEKPWNHNIF